MKTCLKRGCGAQAIIVKPCYDGDCPQRWVSAETYAKVSTENDKLTKENERLILAIAELADRLVALRAQLGHTQGVDGAEELAREQQGMRDGMLRG